MNFPLALSLLVQVTMLLSAGLLAAAAARHARAAVRHIILASTFAGLLVLPLAAAVTPAALPLPDRGSPVPAAGHLRDRPARELPAMPPLSGLLDARAPNSAASRAALPARAAAWATAAWLAGSLVFLLPLVSSLRRVRRLRRTALPSAQAQQMVDQWTPRTGVPRPVGVLLHEDINAPLTSGVARPVIILPADAMSWPADELRHAALHELEHIRRADWWTQLGARALCAAWWWHPLVWIAFRRLAIESERACDDAVVAEADSTSYAEQLLTLARRASATAPQPLLSMAGRSDLSVRISALLDDTVRRGRVRGRTAVAIIGIGLLASVALSPLRAGAAPAVLVDGPVEDLPPVPAVGQDDNVNEVFPGDGTRLIIAARSGDVQRVRDLLDRGADPNLASLGDGNPLIMAAGRGDLAITTLLLDGGANVDGAVRGDGNPLIAAAGRGNLDVVRLLLDRGADVNAVVPGDENALIQASGAGHLPVVRLLIDRNADVNARVEALVYPGAGQRGAAADAAITPRTEIRTPLRMAERHGHKAVADYLRSKGAVD